MLPLEHPDRIQITFDDHRLVNNAGLLLSAILVHRNSCSCRLGQFLGWTPVSAAEYSGV